jgi:hypothetical protein
VGERLSITRLGASDAGCRVADFVWSGSEAAVGEIHGAGGQRWLERSWMEAETDGRRTRWLARYLAGDPLRALEHIRFELSATEFIEAALYRRRAGPNLHRQPIRLPAKLELGVSHHPVDGADARVTMVFVGRVELRVGKRHASLRAMLLRGEHGAQARDQWLAAGTGEIALGPADTAPERWLAGWQAGRHELLGPVAVPACWPDLAEAGPDQPQSSIF